MARRTMLRTFFNIALSFCRAWARGAVLFMTVFSAKPELLAAAQAVNVACAAFVELATPELDVEDDSI